MNNVIVGSNGMVWGAAVVLVLGVAAGLAFFGKAPDKKVLSAPLSQPLNGARSAKINLCTSNGHITIDRQNDEANLLASGELQYLENQEAPAQTLNSSVGQTVLTIKDKAVQSGFRLPWAACKVDTEWQVHLNPAVSTDISAHSGGGNIRLDLAGTKVTGVAVETGGGNMDLRLPENASNLDVTAGTGGGNVTVEIGSGMTGGNSVKAKTGAGNVVVLVPQGMAARVNASSGLGKVIMDARFVKVGENTYQSDGYDNAANKVDITVNSGAGNVSVKNK